MNAPGEPRWLSSAELHTWRSLMALLARLPAVLEVELQRDAQLSFLEYYVLAALSEAPDRRMRLSELAQLTKAELSRISHLISRLERRAFVTRVSDPTNGRFTQAILTDGGMAHLAAAAPGHVAEVQTVVFDGLDADDRAHLDKILSRIVSRLDP